MPLMFYIYLDSLSCGYSPVSLVDLVAARDRLDTKLSFTTSVMMFKKKKFRPTIHESFMSPKVSDSSLELF